MATYLIINLIVIVVAAVVFTKWLRRPSKACAVTLLILVLLTAIFDNVIIGAGIVNYNPHKILGVKIGLAPIEDFMYPLLAVIIIPALWRLFGGKNDK